MGLKGMGMKLMRKVIKLKSKGYDVFDLTGNEVQFPCHQIVNTKHYHLGLNPNIIAWI